MFITLLFVQVNRYMYLLLVKNLGEILDIPKADTMGLRLNFLKHQRDSLVKIDPSVTSVPRQALGSIRRSRKTPPLKIRHNSVGE